MLMFQTLQKDLQEGLEEITLPLQPDKDFRFSIVSSFPINCTYLFLSLNNSLYNQLNMLAVALCQGGILGHQPLILI